MTTSCLSFSIRIHYKLRVTGMATISDTKNMEIGTLSSM